MSVHVSGAPGGGNRVLLFITSLDRGGAQRHVRDLLAARPDGFEFSLAGGGEGWLAGEAARLGVTVHPLTLEGAPQPLRDIQAYRHLVSLLNTMRPDLLHVHSAKAAILGRLAARKLGIPVIYTCHGWAFQTGVRGGSAVLGILGEYLLGGVPRRVIVVSERDAAVARRLRLARPAHMTVIENGIQFSDYPWHAGLYGRRLVYVGRLERGKGLERLLMVLTHLRQYRWELTVCGEGHLRPRLEATARHLGLAARIRFTGWLDDVHPVLAAADCLVLPSDKEGLPYSVLEALACGLFAVVTSVGALDDLNLRQITRIPPRSTEALGAALREFLAEACCNPERLPCRSEVAALFATRFSLKRMIKEISMVYWSVLNSSQPHRSEFAAPASTRGG